MTNWYRYWKRIGHIPKDLCDSYPVLDSFAIFKNKDSSRLKVFNDRFSVEVTNDESSLQVSIGDFQYSITVEKQPCYFGGFRYFLRCPKRICNRRMRKLYSYGGIFLCRKCLNLGYYSQRVVPSRRFWLMQKKLEDKLNEAGGGLWQKPKWMHNKTFSMINARHTEYEWKSEEALFEEFYLRYGEYP